MALVRITGSTDGIGLAAARSFSGRATGWWCTPAAPSAASLRVGAVDPGWVKTKLASRGAPGDVRSGGARVARAAANPDWPGGYTAGARPARLSDALTSPRLQDELLTAVDRLAGSTG